ncbi:MAG: hypothetical protein J6X49_05885 [Victivallales bacterium]|nr:hypothetical protein [Victivallales bacterium]
MWHLCLPKNRLNALGMQWSLGIGTYQASWLCLHKFCKAMIHPGREGLEGIVEDEEAFIGEEREGRRGRGVDGKKLTGVAIEDKIYRELGSLTFGTYLIIVHPLVWRRFVNWHIDNLSLGGFLLLFAGLLAGMQAGSFIIEAARQFVFKILSSNCAFLWIKIIHNKRNTHFK